MYKYSLTIVLSALLASAVALDCNYLSWTTVSSSGPRPTNIGAHNLVPFLGDLYVFGGFKEDFETFTNTFYRTLYKFDTSTDTWSILSSSGGPTARAFAGADALTILSKLYVYGGLTYNGDFSNITLYDDFWKWDFFTNSWSEVDVNSEETPGPRADYGFVALGGKLYLFGGIVNEFFTDSNELWRFNPILGTWTLLQAESEDPSRPSARHGMQMVADPWTQKIYMYGGEITNTGFGIAADTWVYDPDTNTWTDVTPADEADNVDPPRNNMRSMASLGKKMVFYGGDISGGVQDCNAPFPQNPVNETWSFNVETKIWKKLTRGNTPPRLKRNAGANIGNCYVTHGGWDFNVEDCQVYNDDLFTLRISLFHGARSEPDQEAGAAEDELPVPRTVARPVQRVRAWNNGASEHPLVDVINQMRAERRAQEHEEEQQ